MVGEPLAVPEREVELHRRGIGIRARPGDHELRRGQRQQDFEEDIGGRIEPQCRTRTVKRAGFRTVEVGLDKAAGSGCEARCHRL